MKAKSVKETRSETALRDQFHSQVQTGCCFEV